MGVQLLLAREGTVALPARELDASFCDSFVKGNDVIEQVSMLSTFTPANGAVDDHRAGQHCLVRQRCLVFSKELVRNLLQRQSGRLRCAIRTDSDACPFSNPCAAAPDEESS